jgi:hypothetical protein
MVRTAALEFNEMSDSDLISSVRKRIVAALFVACALMVPAAANAQVVVVANGSPITELDITQRSKLIATSTRKTPARQEVIQELIDDRIKIAKAKSYGMEISDAEVNNAFDTMAQRQHMNAQQFSQVLERSGIMPQTVKARVRAQSADRNQGTRHRGRLHLHALSSRRVGATRQRGSDVARQIAGSRGAPPTLHLLRRRAAHGAVDA